MISNGQDAPRGENDNSPSSPTQTSAARMASKEQTSPVQGNQPSTDELRDALRLKQMMATFGEIISLMMKPPPHKRHSLTAQIKREPAMPPRG